MDYLSQIIIVGIYATAAMTAFSYVFSHVFKGNFKEPQLLNYLLDKYPSIKSSYCREHIIGWVIHFSIGCFFVTVFKILISIFAIPVSLQTGLIFGGIAGLVGVGVWHFMFYLHPNPPRIKKSVFYMQLFIAHLIFGVIMIWSLNSISC